MKNPKVWVVSCVFKISYQIYQWLKAIANFSACILQLRLWLGLSLVSDGEFDFYWGAGSWKCDLYVAFEDG